MKLGFTFFTHISTVTFAARIGVLPLIILAINWPVRHWLFLPLWILAVLAVVVTLLTLPLHVPTGAMVEKFIEKYVQDYDRRLKERYAKYQDVRLEELRGYTSPLGLPMQRRIGETIVMPYLVLVSLVHTEEGTWFVSEIKSLMTTKPCRHVEFLVEDADKFALETAIYDKDRGLKQLDIRYGEYHTEIYLKDDYRLREFMVAIEAGQKA